MTDRGVEPFWDDRLFACFNKAVEMLRNGYSVGEIADEMDVSDSSVRSYLAEARAILGSEVVPLLPRNQIGYRGADWDRIQALLSKGLTAPQIAERLGCSELSIRLRAYRARRKAGVPIKRQVDRSADAVAWWGMRRNGHTVREIAWKYGVTEDVVSGTLTRYRGAPSSTDRISGFEPEDEGSNPSERANIGE